MQTITLPAVEPLDIANYTNFGLTMTQDSNYLTNDLYPNQPDQGVGYDQTAITITTSTTSTATSGPLPDLATSSVVAPVGTVTWGQSFPVSTVVQNLGQGDAGAFQVFYLLTGQAGSINDAIYLGQTDVSGLAAGANDPITQTLTLPTRLPSGVSLGNVGYGRIAVIVDPDNFINETLKSNNETISAPFIVRLPGSATTVPTDAGGRQSAHGRPGCPATRERDQGREGPQMGGGGACQAGSEGRYQGGEAREKAPSKTAAQDELGRRRDGQSRHGSDEAPPPDLQRPQEVPVNRLGGFP